MVACIMSSVNKTFFFSNVLDETKLGSLYKIVLNKSKRVVKDIKLKRPSFSISNETLLLFDESPKFHSDPAHKHINRVW